MRICLLFWILLLMSCFSCNAYEWLYPVASLTQNGQTRLFVIHQKSIDHIELWLWDPQTHIASKALLSSYVPAALQLIPNNIGFSFIDAGRIRIKDFSKRSPKAIDIYEPIYDINKLTWLNEHVGYVAARQIELFELFMVCNHGHLVSIAQDPNADCMYPQCIDNALFYIKRTESDAQHYYSIVQSDYPLFTCPYELPEDKRIDYVRTQAHNKSPIMNHHTIVNWGTLPIAFLNMISDHEGFFIQHPAAIDKHEPLLPCEYYRIYFQENSWQVTKLFNFTLPAYLLFDKQLRLYESMLPLLPRHHNKTVYYLHTDSEQKPLQLYCYNCVTHSIKQLSTSNVVDQSFIAPLLVDTILYYGGTLTDDQIEHRVGMWIEDENVCFKLPVLPIS